MERKTRVQRKKRRWVRITGLVLLFTVLLICSGAGYLYVKANQVATESYSELDRGEKSELRTEPVNVGKDNFSVLIMGDDARPGEEHARSDAMLVATFNREKKSIILTSIPRDSYVEIVGKGKSDKITHANAFGGVDMAVDTVENLLQIPIDHYAIAKFDGLKDIVDSLGGIDVDVAFTFDFTEKGKTLHFTEGPSHLNGEEALAYSRERKNPKAGGDFGRGQRQQQVIESIINDAASISSIQNYDKLFESLGGNLRTDLSFANILSLHGYATSLEKVETVQLSGEPFRGSDGISYVRVDEDSLQTIRAMLKEHLDLQ
ncbi:LCP family glycopolymer transferase [Alkalicoccobacillus plakortidis]|uniref:LCP family protein n=1 Tax=Alkalicoccobacillus plakortidis TaxID=444060 RepID=A0ABT0XK31_9BACI|nr:LCP family protein [Alkalicoccobacillus plakortidis]MCM2676264.1 LCP family protein [Alkalicoccobacillus plakortidis]